MVVLQISSGGRKVTIRHGPFCRGMVDRPPLRAGDQPRDRESAALASERRRHIVAILHASDTPLSVSDLADKLAHEESGPDGFSPDGSGGQQVTLCRHQDPLADQLEILLHHQHLPNLAEVGLVNYDPQEKTVSLGVIAEKLGLFHDVDGIP